MYKRSSRALRVGISSKPAFLNEEEYYLEEDQKKHIYLHLPQFFALMARNKPHHDAEKDAIQWDNGGCIIFKPRALNIVWGEDTRYWKLPNPGEKDGTADLIQVSWLEVTGTTDPLDFGKYEVGFRVTIKADAFGWKNCQVFLMAKVGKKGRYNWKKVSLVEGLSNKEIPEEKFQIEVKTENSEDKKLYFGLYEVWSGKWKGGLSIHEAFVKKVST